MDIVGRRRQSENALAGLTLTAVLTNETNPPQTRTLFDIIQEDKGGKESKKPWKSFKEKIRLRRAGSAWTSTVPIPASDVVVQQSGNRTITRTHSNRFSNVPNAEDSDSNSDSDDSLQPAGGGANSNRGELNSTPSNNRSMMLRGNSIRAPQRQPSRMMVRESVTGESAEEEEELPSDEEEESEEEEDEMATIVGGGGAREPRVRMSLMALLAETDKEMGLDGSKYMVGGGGEEEEEEDEEGGGGGGGDGEYSNCCVCMVRHKGSAFIPCGHTFCRLCSRELWVQRGSCPLCNNYILEILDIF